MMLLFCCLSFGVVLAQVFLDGFAVLLMALSGVLANLCSQHGCRRFAWELAGVHGACQTRQKLHQKHGQFK